MQEVEVPQDETEHEESVLTPSNNPQPSGEDNMQLTDLMVLCTKLQTQVLDLQKAKDAQSKEIAALKKRIQRLERRKMSRPTGLKRLSKVGMSRRVESSKDQESLGVLEDASKQGRSIEDIDADVDVSLVDEAQERQNDDLMFDSGVLEDDVMHVEAKVDGKDEHSKKLDDSTAGEAVTTCGIDDTAELMVKEEGEESILLALLRAQEKRNRPFSYQGTNRGTQRVLWKVEQVWNGTALEISGQVSKRERYSFNVKDATRRDRDRKTLKSSLEDVERQPVEDYDGLLGLKRLHWDSYEVTAASGLEYVEARLLVYKKNESVYEEDIKETLCLQNLICHSLFKEFYKWPYVIKPIVEKSKAKASEAKPKAVRKNNSAPIF
ncbi:hypothetical protein Tco_0237593 [Tanacetum coccineum]